MPNPISRYIIRKLYCLLLAVLFSPNTAFAQKPTLPAGYALQDSVSGIIRADFDGDGRQDIFCSIISAKGLKLFASLEGGRRKLLSRNVDDAMCCGSMSYKGGVLHITSLGMRFFVYYKWRYNKAAGDFQLIGYDTEHFGNAANDGSGTSSLNLLTGDYADAFNSYDHKREKLIALPKTKRRLKVGRRILLREWDAAAEEWVSSLMYAQVPEQVR